MNLFRSFQPAASAPVARERLQILLEYDRKLGSQIDLFMVLREEILAVISRHIVDPENVQFTVDRGAKVSTLGVNIEIPNPGGKALPTDCAVLHRDKTAVLHRDKTVLHRDKTAGTRGLRVNKGRMMRTAAAAPGSLTLPIWLVGTTVGAIVLAVKRAGSVPLITVGLIAALILGVYAQHTDAGKRRALDDRETAMAGFEEQVNAPRPAEEVVAATGPSVVLPRMHAPGTVGSLPRDATGPEPVLQSAAITLLDAPGSVTSSPRELPSAAAEPVLQPAGVTPPATLGSATSPPNEPPTATSQERPPGNVTPLPPRRPLQISIATPPRAVPPSRLLRRREAP
jgi:cell division topological specificity factor